MKKEYIILDPYKKLRATIERALWVDGEMTKALEKEADTHGKHGGANADSTSDD